MFKQMLISSASQPTRRKLKSFVYDDTYQKNKLNLSLDKLNIPNYSIDCLTTYSAPNRCKSAKTYRDYKNLDCFPLLNLDELTKDYLQLNNKSENSNKFEIVNQVQNPTKLGIEEEKTNLKPQQDNNNLIRIENQNIQKKLRILSSKFRERTASVKVKLEEHLSSDESLVSENDNVELKNHSDEWFQEYYEKENKSLNWNWNDIKYNFKNLDRFISDYDLNLHTYELYSISYISWLIILNFVYFYNCFFIVLRTFFPIQTKQNLLKFILFDLFCDLIYIIDIFWFKSRLKYFENGLLINEAHLTRKKYFHNLEFKIDCYSLLPLEIFYLFIGVKPILRLPRLIKINCFHELFHCLDSIAKYPYIFRILKTLIYMIFLVHLNATAYYFISYLNNFDENNQWIYNNQGNAYLRCFYFAIRTATSISGRMPKPNNSTERVFMTVSWLMGVFVFAFLIGQIRDIVANATQNETHYRMILDQTIDHMNNLNIPKNTQQRVKDWINFTFKQQNTFDELVILNSLPTKIYTDISLNLHLDMLKQVELFQVVERPVICEFVTKLRPILFLPGDFIFKKDDIGTDMYIVNNGKVQVFADKECTKLLVTLGKGSVFGEISVLDISGSSKRTASIRSVGYSTLFRLQKTDLLEILNNYPEVHMKLRKKASELIKKRATRSARPASETDSELFSIRAESVIKNPIIDNKYNFANTVIQLLKQKKRE